MYVQKDTDNGELSLCSCMFTTGICVEVKRGNVSGVHIEGKTNQGQRPKEFAE